MRMSLKMVILCAAIGLVAVPALADRSDEALGYVDEQPNPRPGEPGHLPHEEWQGDFASPQAQQNFKVVRSMPLPEGFLGNMAVDVDSGRVWLVSLGPPTSRTASRLYEIDRQNGKVIASAEMPFQGDLSSPVYVAGHLYQSVFHQSKMFKISVDRANFGEIVKEVPLPTLNDLNLVDESHAMPFIEFGGVAATPDDHLVIHADDVGEFIKIHRDTGEILARTRTLKALGGIMATARHNGDFLIVGNSDPRGGYCALSYPPELSRSPEQKDISWALLNGETGEVLASIRRQNSRVYASGVALLAHQEIEGAPYGRFSFLATGEEGLLEVEWTPTVDAY